MGLAKHDDMVGALAADGSDQPFGDALFDTHPLNPSVKNRTVRRVSVSQQIPRRGVPRKGLRNLVGKPHLAGIRGHAEMNDFCR
jgi:hypothetical protein